MKKGILVNILRQAGGDSTLNGVSNQFTNMILIGKGIPTQFEIHHNEPHLLLIKRHLFGKDVYHVKPVNYDQESKWHMFGGNYCEVSGIDLNDNRIPIVLKIHDRIEN